MAPPELKAFDCFDHDPIDEWIPDSDADVHFSLCLHIGRADEDGADLFYVEVATPQAINEHNLGKTLGQRKIIVNPYSWELVLKEVNAILAECRGDNWLQQSEFLAEHFSWEYENYRP